MAETRIIPEELPVNRDLLNPDFNGYKLSLDDIPLKETKTKSGLLEVPLSGEECSFHHLKLFGQRNLLVLDPWFPQNVYYVNTDLDIVCHSLSEGPEFQKGHVVCEISRKVTKQFLGGFHIGLIFSDEFHAFVSDGNGKLLVAVTENRSIQSQSSWVLQEVDYQGPEQLILLSSTLWKRQNVNVAEVLVIYVDQVTDTQASGDQNLLEVKVSKIVLEWITISRDLHQIVWKTERIRRIQGNAVPNFVAMEPQGTGISVAGESSYSFVFDSVKPIDNSVPMDTVSEEPVEVDPEYTWTQTNEEVMVYIMVPPSTARSSLHFTLTSNTITFFHESGKMLIDGTLYGQVDPSPSTWTLENNKVELTLSKKNNIPWKSVVAGDLRGKEVFSDEQLEEMTERLAGMTSDKWVTSIDVNMRSTQEFEECDLFSDSSAIWSRIDGETHLTTHMYDISGNPFLFNALFDRDALPCICLRHDVDGLLFRPSVPTTDSDSACEHVGTFDALGYVMASKRDRKFASCSPNMSFAALCDDSRNIYIYRNDVPVESTLKNRKTGKIVKTIAKQHVLSLDKVGPILGFATSNNTVFILKRDVLIAAVFET